VSSAPEHGNNLSWSLGGVTAFSFLVLIILPTDASGDQASAVEPTEPFTHHLRRVGAFGLVLTGVLGIPS